MTYVEGFIVAVPTARREDYRRHAESAVAIFEEFGLRRMVECWGSDVPDGETTSFAKAVQAKPDETVVFSWFEHASREARDAFNEKMMADPRMEAMGTNMPFDGKRMVMGGFAPLLDEGTGRGAFVDGLVLPVPHGNREAYLALAQKAAADFQSYGALRLVEAWGDDLPDGQVTDFRRAVKAEAGENVVFSWIEWPDKATRDAGWGKMMADPNRSDHPKDLFDGTRMFWGGFDVILDKSAAQKEPS
jgi:uncharacterized protein YbaA (DUF1428 family)